MFEYFIFSIFFFLPAGIANSVPVIAAQIPFLKKYHQPLDFGHSYRGVRIFGDHKTIRGIISGTLVAILLAVLQVELYQLSPSIQSISPLDYTIIRPLILGFLLGFGALAGDAVKSFFKRRTHIKPGKSWFPFDQLDYIIGGLLLSSLYVTLSWSYYLSISLVWFGLHLAATSLGYILGLKDSPL